MYDKRKGCDIMESLLTSLATTLYASSLILNISALSKCIGGEDYARRYKWQLDSALVLLIVAILFMAIRETLF